MKYRSEDDKYYGVAGMAIGLSIFDATELFTGIDLDADGFDCICFAPEFYFAGNPRVSAKEAWQEMYTHYQISMGLVIANTMCRKMVLDRGVVDRKLRSMLLNAICDEGKELCQLEKDEVKPIFDRYFSHLMRVFSNAGICNAITEMVELLKAQRTFTRAEITDMLQALSIVE